MVLRTGAASRWRRLALGALVPLAAVFAVACSSDDEAADATAAATAAATTAAATAEATPESLEGQTLVVYSGRNEALIAPLLEQFSEATGVTIEAKYGSSSEMAATLLEEGSRSPADVFLAQDTGALGAVEQAGLFAPLDASLLNLVPAEFRSNQGGWVGLSGRVRVIVYNKDAVAEADLPTSVKDVIDPKWQGRVGWAPTNASLQAFVTAFRLVEGDDAARAWLQGMLDNGAVVYPNNGGVVQAVADGEVDLGLVNHYYLFGFLRDQGPDFPVANHYTAPGDIGSLVGVAGGGILKTAKSTAAAQALMAYMLSEEGQRYFSEQTFEYPVIASVQPSADLPGLSSVTPPDLDLNDLSDLQGTIELMRSVGALQ
ncbi:MAG: iron ABC transporter substrate-binding protein [Chloroflexota bacterium]